MAKPPIPPVALFALLPILALGTFFAFHSHSVPTTPASPSGLLPPPIGEMDTSAKVEASIEDAVRQNQAKGIKNADIITMIQRPTDLLDAATTTAQAQAVKDYASMVYSRGQSLISSLGMNPDPTEKQRQEAYLNAHRWLEIAADARLNQLGASNTPAASYDQAKSQALGYAKQCDAITATQTPVPHY